MEFKKAIYETHFRNVSSVAINSARRELFTGSDDGSIKTWDSETGKYISTISAHKGSVTSLIFCKELRVLISSSVDGSIIIWGNGKILQKIDVKLPVHSMSYSVRRQQLIIGIDCLVKVLQIIPTDDYSFGHDFIDPKILVAEEHTDIVRCVLSAGGRIYSAGYDRKLVVYHPPHNSDTKLRIVSSIPNAHDAAISCICHGRDGENAWIITGSFDRTVRLWSVEGNLMHKFDCFNDTITSVCYVSPLKNIWVTAGFSEPLIFDPRSLVNVSTYVETGNLLDHETRHRLTLNKFVFKNFVYIPETLEIIVLTSRRDVILWRYNASANLCVLRAHEDGIETIAFTTKEPILIFSAGGDGIMRQWERLQTNAYIYNQEVLPCTDDKEFELQIRRLNAAFSPSALKINTTFDPDATKRRTLQIEFHKNIKQNLAIWRSHALNYSNLQKDPSGQRDKSWRNTMQKQIELMSKRTQEEFHMKQRQLELASKKKGVYKAEIALFSEISTKMKSQRKSAILKSLHCESLDLLLCGYDDGRIQIWGYTEEIVPNDYQENNQNVQTQSTRISGLVAQLVLNGHKDSVTSLVSVYVHQTQFLCSSGHDRRLVVWNLSNRQLHGVLRKPGEINDELAADGHIEDIDYSSSLNCIAYCSTDKNVYIRSFDITPTPLANGSVDLPLRFVLQGHKAQVTSIRWNEKISQWVSGSEDRTIMFWSANEPVCLRIIDNEAPVWSLGIDSLNGCILTGGQDCVLRIIDSERQGSGSAIVQRHCGHQDGIRSVAHLAIRNQYITGSWDMTIRVWNALIKRGQPIISFENSSITEGEMGSEENLSAGQASRPNVPIRNRFDINTDLNFFDESQPAPPKEDYEYSRNTTEEAAQKAKIDLELQATLNTLEKALTMGKEEGEQKRRMIPSHILRKAINKG